MPGTAGYRVWGRGKGLEEESGGEEWRGTLKLGMSGQTIPEEDDDDDGRATFTVEEAKDSETVKVPFQNTPLWPLLGEMLSQQKPRKE